MFCFKITDHVKKCKYKFVYPHITKELRARYKVHVYEIQLEFTSVGFCGGRKTGEPSEKQTRKTLPLYDGGSGERTRVTLVGGECHLTIAAPPM